MGGMWAWEEERKRRDGAPSGGSSKVGKERERALKKEKMDRAQEWDNGANKRRWNVSFRDFFFSYFLSFPCVLL